MFGYMVLLNLANRKLTINGIVVETPLDFEGFHTVPPGKYTLSLAPSPEEKIFLDLEVKPGEALACSYNEDGKKLEPVSSEKNKHYRQMALSGAMDDQLIPFPEDGASSKNIAEKTAAAITQKWDLSKLQAALQKEKILKLRNQETKVIVRDENDEGSHTEVADTETIDVTELQKKVDFLSGDKTKCTSEDLEKLEEAFQSYLQETTHPNLTVYEQSLRTNLLLDEQIGQEKDYFLQLVDRLIAHLEQCPALAHSTAKTYYILFQESMMKLGSPEGSERAEKLGQFLQ